MSHVRRVQVERAQTRFEIGPGVVADDENHKIDHMGVVRLTERRRLMASSVSFRPPSTNNADTVGAAEDPCSAGSSKSRLASAELMPARSSGLT